MGFESGTSHDTNKGRERPLMTPEDAERFEESESERDTSRDVRSMPIITQEQIDELGFHYKINKNPEVVASPVDQESPVVKEVAPEVEAKSEERDTSSDVRSMPIITQEQIIADLNSRKKMSAQDSLRDTSRDARSMPIFKPKKTAWQRVRSWF